MLAYLLQQTLCELAQDDAYSEAAVTDKCTFAETLYTLKNKNIEINLSSFAENEQIISFEQANPFGSFKMQLENVTFVLSGSWISEEFSLFSASFVNSSFTDVRIELNSPIITATSVALVSPAYFGTVDGLLVFGSLKSNTQQSCSLFGKFKGTASNIVNKVAIESTSAVYFLASELLNTEILSSADYSQVQLFNVDDYNYVNANLYDVQVLGLQLQTSFSSSRQLEVQAVLPKLTSDNVLNNVSCESCQFQGLVSTPPTFVAPSLAELGEYDYYYTDAGQVYHRNAAEIVLSTTTVTNGDCSGCVASKQCTQQQDHSFSWADFILTESVLTTCQCLLGYEGVLCDIPPTKAATKTSKAWLIAACVLIPVVVVLGVVITILLIQRKKRQGDEVIDLNPKSRPISAKPTPKGSVAKHGCQQKMIFETENTIEPQLFNTSQDGPRAIFVIKNDKPASPAQLPKDDVDSVLSKSTQDGQNAGDGPIVDLDKM